MFCYKIKLHSIIFFILTVFRNRERSVCFGWNRLASVEQTSRYQHELRIWSQDSRCLLCLFSFIICFFFPLSFSFLSSSVPLLFLPFHHFPCSPCPFLHSFVTLPSPGNARSLFLSVSPMYLFARSLLRFLSLSFHLCFTRSCVLLTRTRFSSPLSLSLSICRVTSNSPASWLGVEWEERKPDVEILWYIFSFCLVHDFKKNWNSKSLRNLCCFLHVKNFLWNSFNNICCTVCSHDLFSY